MCATCFCFCNLRSSCTLESSQANNNHKRYQSAFEAVPATPTPCSHRTLLRLCVFQLLPSPFAFSVLQPDRLRRCSRLRSFQSGSRLCSSSWRPRRSSMREVALPPEVEAAGESSSSCRRPPRASSLRSTATTLGLSCTRAAFSAMCTAPGTEVTSTTHTHLVLVQHRTACSATCVQPRSLSLAHCNTRRQS